MSDSPKYVKHMAYVTYILILRNKKFAGTILRSALFLFILGALLLGARNILSVPQSGINEKSGMRDIHKYKNSYDVCIVGRSTAVCNISCQELYEQYGIAGVSAAVSSQSFPMTLYTLEEIFNYQSPKVVILDTRAFFETPRAEYLNYQDDSYLHYTLDDINTFSIKAKALEKARRANPEIDPWDYYSKLYYSHENWKKISEKNFSGHDTDSIDAMHGNSAYLLNIADAVPDIYTPSKPYAAMSISLKIEQYVADAVELCEKNGADLMLTTCYTHSTKPHHNALLRLANKYGIKYLDLNDYMTKTDFNYDMDLYDAVHFNLSGAIKMTDLLGDYLQDNYDFADRRKDAAYQRYEDNKDAFQKQKAYIFSKQDLLSGFTFIKYLTALNQLDKSDNVIFLTVYGDAFKNLTVKEFNLLQELGLKTNLLGKNGSSYTAVITEDDVREDFSFVNAAKLEGEIGSLSYEVVSGSLRSYERASIRINDVSAISPGTGFNFAVYNISQDYLLHSCFFDTATSVNPAQSRYKNASATSLQYEIAPNVWKNAK